MRKVHPAQNDKKCRDKMHLVLRKEKYNTNTLRNFIAREKFLRKNDVRFSPALRRFVFLNIRFVFASIQFINDRTRGMIVFIRGDKSSF